MPEHLPRGRIFDRNLRALASPPRAVDKEHAGQFLNHFSSILTTESADFPHTCRQ
jgi:hypothetical protein